MIASAREAGALAARLERLRSLTRRAGADAAFVEEHVCRLYVAVHNLRLVTLGEAARVDEGERVAP